MLLNYGVKYMIRALMAIIMGIAIIAAILKLPARYFDFLLFGIVLAGAFEYSRMFFQDRATRIFSIVAIAVTALSLIFALDNVTSMALVAMVLFFASMFVMWKVQTLSGSAEKLGLIVLGVVYLGISFPFWSKLRAMPDGMHVVLLVLVPACLCDTFAYIFGKTMGKRKFAPLVSPNKTWEGFFGALLGSLIGIFTVWAIFLREFPVHLIVGLAVIIWIVSPLGDLIESLLKRSTGVKDSGSVIPGHGGILDRLDALVFTAPAAFLYMRLVVGYI